MPSSEWFLYLIRCSGGQLYTGITTDVERRFSEHKSGKGAKFLRGKGPLELVFQQQVGDRSAASRTEVRVKKMSKSDKEKMIISGTIKPAQT
ncbi:putative endonuclease [Mariprofundus micogutta]|uniref:Putative endonuclease n=1 Tax=Mariprofundus micogutta TaxID=1921010 RepID=A0A1L8CR94_9PROT|nr:GIY-YIG nuclease family protein [Mariprofundus micogutta]GAV21438.1 putative endonuclease [Mariprofundus micogutta]